MRRQAPSRIVHDQQGLTLIEIMIALVIGLFLLIGLIQIFSASRTAYQLSEGLARTQEDGRFAIDFLQRDIRMAGHAGCVNDEAHALSSTNSYMTAFAAGSPSALRFDVAIQGYEASSSAPGGALTIPATPVAGGSGWTPALPADIASALSDRIAGSDILVLRFLRPEGIPVTAVAGTAAKPALSFDASRWDVLRSGVTNPGLFGVADCLNATVFEAGSTTGGVITSDGAPLTVGFSSVYTAGQSMLYRAESVIYYVGLSAQTNRPALRRVRFEVTPGGASLSAPVGEDLVDGVENMQLLFARDRQTDTTLPPTGYIDQVGTASWSLDPLTNPASVAAWKRVGAVQVGLLLASPDRAASAPPAAMPVVQGVQLTTPADGRYRSVYQTTIALRNRLYGG